MNAIWKYELSSKSAKIEMPKGAVIISAQVQMGAAVIWALVDPREEMEIRKFGCFATGDQFEANGCVFIGTLQFNQGSLVYHCFELPIN